MTHLTLRRPAMIIAALATSVALTIAVPVPAPAVAVPQLPTPTASEHAAAMGPGPGRPGHGLDERRLQEALDVFTAEYGVAAVAEVVGPNGHWAGASGVRRLDPNPRPARPQDQFRIASLTKPMVATLALQEVARRRWSLSTTVDSVLPGLLPGHDPITVEQLLSHRSGLPEYLTPIIGGAASPQQAVDLVSVPRTDHELIGYALAQPWAFEPGTAFGYSNTNYVVVAMMLAALNRRPVADLIRDRIFRPARMHHSSYPSGPGITGAHLSEYAIFDRPYTLDTFDPSLFSSAGAVVSTTEDLNRFWRALATGRLLPRSLVDTMTTPLTAGTLPYGLGTFTAPDPCSVSEAGDHIVFGHDGLSFGTHTLSMTSRDGQRRFTVATTGRSFAAGATPVPFEQFFAAAFTATCPATHPTTRRSVEPMWTPDRDTAARQ